MRFRVIYSSALLLSLYSLSHVFAEQGDGLPLDIRVSEPFTVASAPPTFAFPTLQQLAMRDLRLVVRSRCLPQRG